MIVTYTPADGEKKVWQYQQSELSSREAEDVEEATGMLFAEWQMKVLQGSMRARRGLLWMLLKRDDPKLRFDDVAFRVDELEVDWDAQEKKRVRTTIEHSKDLSEENKRLAMQLLAGGDDDASAGDEDLKERSSSDAA